MRKIFLTFCLCTSVFLLGKAQVQYNGYTVGIEGSTVQYQLSNDTGASFINGKLGVGVQHPVEKLDIDGKIRSNGVLVPTGGISIGNAEPINSSALFDASSTNKGILIPRMTASQRLAIDNPPVSLLVFDMDSLNYAFYNGSNWEIIGRKSSSSLCSANGNDIQNTNTGRVLIGTQTAPEEYKLAVYGTALFTKAKVKPSPWFDYVFYEDYKLPSLDEVEKFIKLNKHLPEIPSANEVKKEGIDLGLNVGLQLKKIEELTLYVIAQNHQIQTQEAEISAQNKKIQQLQIKFDELVKRLEKEAN